MDLNNVTVEMRPRSEWEAVDFGARLVRRDARVIYGVWFAVTGPMLLLAIAATLFTSYGGLALFLYWWFEPLTDAPILRIISRRLFGESADVKSTLQAMPHLMKRNWIYLVPILRFHLARSIATPVTQLEGLSGTDRRARAKVLGIKISNYGIGVTAAYHHLVMALYIGIYLIGFALIPTAYQETLGMQWLDLSMTTDNRWASVIGLLAFYVAQTLLHPWFVGAGFGLYINCRTQLEAWDIEVAFRRIAQRRGAAIAAVVVCALLIAPLTLAPTTVLAQEDEYSETVDEEEYNQFDGYWSDDEADAALRRALANEALNTTQDIEEWRAIGSDDAEPDEDEISEGAFPDILRIIGRFLAFLFEISLWLVVAALLVLLVLTARRWLPYIGFSTFDRGPRRKIVLSSGELTAESLPDDIPAEVRKLWQAGQIRDALSLLYRGSLFTAVMEYGVRLPHSATEGLCVAAMREQAAASQAQFFDRIVNVWITCAYGFRKPDEADVKPLLADWQQHFGATS